MDANSDALMSSAIVALFTAMVPLSAAASGTLLETTAYGRVLPENATINSYVRRQHRSTLEWAFSNFI